MRIFNWRGIPYYLAKEAIGSREWKAHLREICDSNPTELSRRYLERLLDHACTHVPFYSDLNLKGRPLSEYPIRAKEDLRAERDKHIRKDILRHRTSLSTTSGSTGKALELVQDESVWSWAEATDLWYYENLLGTSRRTYRAARRVLMWPLPRIPKGFRVTWARMARSLIPVLWLDPCEALSEEKLLHYAREIARMRPHYIWGFAGVLYEVARAAQRASFTIPPPKFIISSAETLHTSMRRVIEEAFGCPVYDYYGASEVGRVAAECECGNLHIFTFSCLVEVLDSSGRPVSPGQEGRLVLTPLHNYAMPLIRYDIEDWAEAGPTQCECGCPLPALRRIIGRTVEFFVSAEGHLVSGGVLERLVMGCRWVSGFQMLQRDIGQLEILFHRPPGTTTSENDIERVNARIAGALGRPCRIDWAEVQEIPRSPSGKRPYARSLVWESRQPSSFRNQV
jgi:phenylacetate-CoA ligase